MVVHVRSQLAVALVWKERVVQTGTAKGKRELISCLAAADFKRVHFMQRRITFFTSRIALTSQYF